MFSYLYITIELHFFFGLGENYEKSTNEHFGFWNVREFNSFAYNKIDWAKMDSNNDGYVSPKEMKDHYKKAGVYK